MEEERSWTDREMTFLTIGLLLGLIAGVIITAALIFTKLPAIP